jgi:hypothetical protein
MPTRSQCSPEGAEGAGKAPCPGPTGDQGPQEGAAAQGEGHGGDGGLLVLRKKWEAFCSEDAEG